MRQSDTSVPAGADGRRLGLTSLLVRGAGVALSTAATILVTRALGPEEFGRYSVWYALLVFWAVASQAGLPQWLVREASRLSGVGRWGDVRALAGRSLLVTGVLSVGVAAIFLGTAWWSIRESIEPFWLPAAAAASIPVFALTSVRSALLRGTRYPILGQVPETVVRPAAFAVILAVAMALGVPATPAATDAMAFLLGSAVLALGFTFALRGTVEDTGRSTASPSWRQSAAVPLYGVIPFAALSTVQVLSQQSGVLMTGLLDAAPGVAAYRAGASLAALIALPLAAVNFGISRDVARYTAANRPDQLQRLLHRSIGPAAIISIVAATGVFLGGRPLVRIAFGDAYASAFMPLVILAIGQVANVLMGSAGTVLAMSGRERSLLWILSASTVAALLFHALLIPRYGPEGAALATTSALIVQNVWMAYVVRRDLGVTTLPGWGGR